MNKQIKSLKYLVMVLAILMMPFQVFSADTRFIVEDIKVVGLKRVALGTVLNYLPVEVGEELSADSSSEIIRELYATGFFQSVTLEKKGNTLIVSVVERATISEISIEGNSAIPSDKLKELLKEYGLVKGRVFQRSSLEFVTKQLKQGYNARGKYNAHIKTEVKPLTDNRVSILIQISEGRVSRIENIKITGNHAYTESELLGELPLSTSNLITYFTKKDQYSKATLDAALEALRSFYLDRGYMKFKIVSSQVLLAPDKKDVYINIHLYEGAQYHVSSVEVLGHTKISPQVIRSLIKIQEGDIFSRKKISESTTLIGNAYGDIGYGFPVINANPILNDANKSVKIQFFIDPGRHVYVRRINFSGNTKTADYVLRNVVKQDEAAIISLHNIKETERHMRLLSYIKNVDVKTNPVPGSNNEVDLDVNVEEAPSAEASASIGYGTTGAQLNASLNQYNFMGTGRSVGLAFNASLWGQNYSLNYYNPFYYKNTIGRGFSGYFQKVDPKRLDVTNYNSDRYGGDVNYNFMIDERSSYQFGYGYQGLNILSVGYVLQTQEFVKMYGSIFNEFRLSSGWSRNTYDQMPFPHSGTNQQFGVVVDLPVSSGSLTYYKANYLFKSFHPLPRDFIISFLANLGYGNQFSGNGLPFYENFYAGGIAQPGMVRGYSTYSLGPQDSQHHGLGGNILASGSLSLILPYPLSRETFRTLGFLDFGNVFINGLPEPLKGSPAGPIRYSAGLALDWRSPFGPLTFSFGFPLNMQESDQKEYFQFTASSAF
ncbi:MAG: outer membrane protein assembly factor BamA [Gammaproteobacteria bacterium]|nr:outer membrane protein assembly factor BamA [Gammaproteobacteria bacterium]